jgi:DNA-binding NtrC family response regulator
MVLRQKLDTLVEEMIAKGIRFGEARREFEKTFLSRVLAQQNGNLTRAARILRLHRNTLRKKVDLYKL